MQLMLTNREQAYGQGEWLVNSFDQSNVNVRNSWLVEHTEDDGHGDVTAWSLSVKKGITNPETGAVSTGALSVEGSASFAGDVVADYLTTPITLGALVGQVSGSVGKVGIGIDLNGLASVPSQGRWTWVIENAGTNRSLYLLDRSGTQPFSESPLRIQWNTTGPTYYISPAPGTALPVVLGDPSASFGSGYWAGMYGKLVGVGSSDFGTGGDGCIAIRNAAANPSTNPANGGVLYVDAGTLKYRGSGGTVTPIAPA